MNKQIGSFLFDLGCLVSVIGIWPRFIEPRLLKESTLHLPFEEKHLQGLRMVHFTDLHFHQGVSRHFLDKVAKRIQALAPDLILFTGDFLCYARLEAKERLQAFLDQLQAPLGCFCTLGNHDYAAYVSRDQKGNYIQQKPLHPFKGIVRGLQTLFKQPEGKGSRAACALGIDLHAALCALLKETPFTLLENTTVTLPIGLNLTGLGDYGLGRCLPEKAFASYQETYPGIVLSHNPDTLPLLMPYPGKLLLSGHTHGEQIHFPFPPFLRALSKKLARLENPLYTRGKFVIGEKILYVNRGIGSHKPFRFCSPPEILLIEGT